MKKMLSHVEYQKWISYFTYKEPDVQETQMAFLMSMVSSGLGGKGKVEDFLISKPQKTAKKDTLEVMGADDVKAVFAGFAHTMG